MIRFGATDDSVYPPGDEPPLPKGCYFIGTTLSLAAVGTVVVLVVRSISKNSVDFFPLLIGMLGVAGILLLGYFIWWLRDAQKVEFAALIQIALAVGGTFTLLWSVPNVWALVAGLALGSFQIADGIEKLATVLRAKRHEQAEVKAKERT